MVEENIESKRYSLPTKGMPVRSAEQDLSLLTSLMKRMREVGVAVHGTRLRVYQSFLEKIVSGCEPAKLDLDKLDGVSGHPMEQTNELEHLLYVYREVHELNWIEGGLQESLPVGIEISLKLIAGGRPFSTVDKDRSARNTQFELRIASYFCRAHYSVDLSTLTDIVASPGRVLYFTECKRIASAAQLRKRLKDASKQLKARMNVNTLFSKKQYGLIALDVTKVAFPRDALTYAVTPDHSRDVLQEKLKTIALELEEEVNAVFQNRQIFFVWLQIHLPMLIRSPATVGTRFSSYFFINPNLGIFAKLIAKGFFVNVLSAGDRDCTFVEGAELEIRNGVVIPKSAIMWFESELASDFKQTGELAVLDPETIVATLEVDGKVVEFPYAILEMTVKHMPVDQQAEIRKYDPIQIGMCLVPAMYCQWFPYKGEDPLNLQSPDPSLV